MYKCNNYLAENNLMQLSWDHYIIFSIKIKIKIKKLIVKKNFGAHCFYFILMELVGDDDLMMVMVVMAIGDNGGDCGTNNDR